MEGSNGETSKANVVSQPKHPKNKGKKGNEKPLGPKTNPNKFKGEKGPCSCVGKRVTMLESVDIEKTNKDLR